MVLLKEILKHLLDEDALSCEGIEHEEYRQDADAINDNAKREL